MKKDKTPLERLLFVPVLLLIIAIMGVACKKSLIVERTSEDVNITGYLDKHSEQFSEFRKMLEISGTSGYLQAYGAYTIFLPTNDAVKAFLAEKGVSSVEEISAQELKDLVTLHLVEDSIKTTDFSDGKLRNATIYGQYLVTGAVNESGTSKILIDNQAKIVKGNVSVGNGIIHVIDKVLKPAKLTVAQTIKADGRFKIFAEALDSTGLFARLNIFPKLNDVVNEKYLTVFAETDAALIDTNIHSYNDLKRRYCHTGNPKNPQDSLYLYVAYHITPQALYFIDIFNPVKLPTFAVVSISTLGKNDNEVVINEIMFNERLEAGAPVKRSESDITASNGVVHTVSKHFAIIKRLPTATCWDVADQPEFRKQAAWRKSEFVYDIATMPPMANLKWDIKTMSYKGNHGANAYWGDVLRTPLVDPAAPGLNPKNRANYIEFITPYMVPGKYKLWVCYPRAGRGGPMQFWFNGKKLSRIVDLFATSGTQAMTDEQREQLGWKRYMGPINKDMNASMGRLLGTVTITEEGSQVIRMQNTNGSYHSDYYIDMFHLIPEKDEQLWPRYWQNGRVQQKGEPD